MTTNRANQALHNEAVAAKILRASLSEYADDDDLIATAIEGETNLYEALNAALAAIVNDQALIDGLTKQIETLAERKGRFQRRKEWVRAAIEQALLTAEVERVELPLATLSIARRKPNVLVDESLIPEKFKKQPPPVVDKAALNKAVESGEIVPGATLGNAQPHLVVRSK